MKEARIDFGRAWLWFWNTQYASDEKWPPAKELEDLKSLVSLANQVVRAIRPSDVADDIGGGAEPMHINWRGIGHIWAALHENADLALIAQSLLGGSN
jgi:hypothetical protein